MFAILLERLSTEEIERHTGLRPIQEELSNETNEDIETVEIKQEPDLVDTNNETYESTTVTTTRTADEFINIKIEDTNINEVNSEQSDIIVRDLAEDVVNQCTGNAYSSITEMQSSSSNSTSNVCVNYINSKTTNTLLQNSRIINNSIKSVNNISINSTQKLYSTSKSNSSIILQKLKPFKCLNCTFATKSESKFINHSYVCEGNTESSLNLDQFECTQNSSLIKKHKCKYCNNSFITRQKLNIHYQQHKQNLKCTKCKKTFLLKKSFEKHLLKHYKNI